jgi:hypothetical protein
MAMSRAAAVTFMLLIAAFLPPLWLMPALRATPEGKYTYYGKVPEKLWRYDYTASTGWRLGYVGNVYYGAGPASAFLLAMGAVEDATEVEVYSLTNRSSLFKGVLNRFEKHYMLIPNGTVFKVVSSKPVNVLLLNQQYLPNATVGPVPHAFYPAVDGSYVGKRFVILASSDLNPWYTIFALEEAEVKIAREDGTEGQTFKLKPNEYRRVLLRSWYMYTIESSGYIMVQCGDPHSYWDTHESYAIPSANGGFTGTDFFSYSNTQWDPMEDLGFRVLALENSTVKVYDLEKGGAVIYELKVPAQGSIRFQAQTQAIRVSSDKPVQIFLLHEGDTTKMAGRQVTRENAYGAGIVFFTVPGSSKSLLYLPVNATNEAIIFASEPTTITIDDLVTVKLRADEYYVLTQPGLHTIVSDKNVVVQLNHWPKQPEFQGLWVSGTVIPALEAAGVKHEITVPPVGASANYMLYYVAGGVAAVAIIAVLLLMRRKKNSS